MSVTDHSLNKRVPLLFLLITCLFLSDFQISGAASDTHFSDPLEYGQVIYRYHEDSPDQLYIVGLSHRDTLTGVNGADTVKAQIEVYRIGDWLIRNKGIDLLLPEGLFLNRAAPDNSEISTVNVPRNDTSTRGPFSLEELEKMLGRNNTDTNAAMLLIESHGINSRQVEDADLYNSVKARVMLLETNRNNSYASLLLRSELDYLQERRTAVMLQKIPDIIEDEYGNGRIKSRRALFTIGMHHIPDIIKYLEQKQITISSPAFTSFSDYSSGVNLLDRNFGLTIIIPRTLIDSRDIVRMTSLDTVR